MATEQGSACMPLTMKMSRASKAGHSMTDAAVNSRLIGLFADPKIYAGAIGCFHLIFETLERVMEKAAVADKRLAKFLLADRALFRTAQFQQDLIFYFGPDWKKELDARSRFPAVDQYLNHLEALAEAQPILLAAHAYTQHSAVASGGQIISKLVRKGLNLKGEPGAGTAAFTFSVPPRDLKSTLKAALDSLESGLSNEEIEAMILQHQDVFISNNEIIKNYRVGFLAPFIASIKLATRSRVVRAVFLGGIALVVAFYVIK